MQIILSSRARKQLQSFSLDIKSRIEEKIDFFTQQENPLLFSKPLGDGFYRFRVGDYRIVFYIENSVMYVDKIDRRDKVYR